MIPYSSPAPSHSHSHPHSHPTAPVPANSAGHPSASRTSLPRSPAANFLSSAALQGQGQNGTHDTRLDPHRSTPNPPAPANNNNSNIANGYSNTSGSSPSGGYMNGQRPGLLDSTGIGDSGVNGYSSGSRQELADYMARSSSAISNLSSSSNSIPPHPGLLRRRSTDTSASGGLDYYWSSLAGAGASSSSSSLGVSPSPSTGLAMSASGISPSPVSSMRALKEARSYVQSKTNDGIAEEEDCPAPAPASASAGAPELTTRSTSTPSQQATPRQPETDDLGANVNKLQALNINFPSSRANNTSYSDSSNMSIEKGGISPGGWSESSRYSTSDSVPPSAGGAGGVSSRQSPANTRHNPQSRPYLEPNSHHSDSESSGSAYSPAEYKLQVGSFDFEDTDSGINRGFMDTSVTSHDSKARESDGSGNAQGGGGDQLVWDVRSSLNSTSTYKQDRPESRGDKEREDEFHRTPMAPANKTRPEIRPPQLAFHDQHDTRHHRSSPTSSGGHMTPKRSPVSRSNVSSGGHYTPTTSGQLGLGFDGINIGSGTASPARSSSSHRSHTDPTPHSAPPEQSEFGDIYGAAKGPGGTENDVCEDDDTLKRRGKKNRSTLPATTSTSSGAIVESLLSPSKEDLLSPDKYARTTTPTRDNGERRGSTPSPNRSPEPPPKSRLRNNSSSRETPEPPSVTEMTSSPQRLPQSLPMIINTSSSPLTSPDRPKLQTGSLDKPQPRRPDRSPDRQHSPVFPSSATINDLTDMLGGAIDAIGLIDSRETPPPTVSEPSKKPRPSMTLALAPAAEVTDRGPMTPTSLPTRGASLPGPSVSSASLATTATISQPFTQDQVQAQMYARRSTQPELKHKASSLFSFGSASGHQQQSPTMAISVRPWPAAMLYGNVKGMKHAGDRAKGYARAINELARSESGLREWCIAVSTQSHRPTVAGLNNNNKMSVVSSLGVRSNSVPSAIPLPYQLSPYDPTPHQRNVSAGSEFPMRADSYAAREISQRVLDPADQPTALPSDLPYPQLQNQAQHLGHAGPSGGAGMGGGLKPSQSMQSVASFSSSKKGFFSAIGRKGTSKKESLSLGPPGSYLGGSGSTAKKDVRGLPISGPRSASPQKDATTPTSAASSVGAGVGGGVVGSSGHALPRAHGSISTPMGPRGPRMGSFTPPPQSSMGSERASMELTTAPGRASLDTGLSRMTPPYRASLDAHRTPRGNGSISGSGSVPMPMRAMGHSDSHSTNSNSNSASASALGGGKGGAAMLWEDEVRSMADILPHVEKSTLRAYLSRYGGDQMQAIGGYLEDEKNGTVLRS
ncbi:hypothetical protein IAU59_001626 [Kwoniella sp. CBS 9459]